MAGVAVGGHGFGVVGIDHVFEIYDSSHTCLLLEVWDGARCLDLVLSLKHGACQSFYFM